MIYNGDSDRHTHITNTHTYIYIYSSMNLYKLIEHWVSYYDSYITQALNCLYISIYIYVCVFILRHWDSQRTLASEVARLLVQFRLVTDPTSKVALSFMVPAVVPRRGLWGSDHVMIAEIPGKRKEFAIENEPFMFDLPLKMMDFPQFFVCLPEGN